MKTSHRFGALLFALALSAASSALADSDTKSILSATYNPATRVITITGN